jgi:hypothetical protein
MPGSERPMQQVLPWLMEQGAVNAMHRQSHDAGELRATERNGTMTASRSTMRTRGGSKRLGASTDLWRCPRAYSSGPGRQDAPWAPEWLVIRKGLGC